MVDSECSTNFYMSVKISIWVVMKNPEIFKLIPDHLKTKTMCKHAVGKLPFERYNTYQYKTQKMCNKLVLQNGRTLQSVPDCYENQQNYDKAVENYHHVSEFVSECFKTQKICDTFPSTIKCL